MKHTKMKKRFDRLRDRILEDGKISIDEIPDLLDFIDQYGKITSEKMFRVRRLLIECQAQGAISDDTSKLLVREVQRMSEFLNIQAKAEVSFYVIVALLIGIWVCCKVLI